MTAQAKAAAAKQLTAVTAGLGAAQISPKIEIAQSTADRTGATFAVEAPARILAATTAGGAAAAARSAAAAGYPDAIALDIGGGEANAALIRRGKARVSNETALGAAIIKLPSIDVRHLGPGLNAAVTAPLDGVIKVGPGCEKPACVGGSGHLPTVMDALAVLHRFPSDRLGLDVSAADAVLASFGSALGMDRHRAADGIVHVYAEAIAGNLRNIAAQKSEDTAQLALVVGGGAGPLLGCAIAKNCGAGPVIVPRNAGVLSVLGCLSSGKSVQFAAALGQTEGELSASDIVNCATGLRARADAWLADEGTGGEIAFRVDVRYRRTDFRTSLEVPAEGLQDSDIAALAAKAAQAYQRRFGQRADQPLEFTTLRAIATAEPEVAALPAQSTGEADPRPALLEQTQAHFSGGFRTTSVFDADKLSAGNQIPGPALIVQADATIAVVPGFSARVDAHQNVVMEADANAAARRA